MLISWEKKQTNKIIEKEREIQKLIQGEIAIYNKKPNYIIECRHYWELARILAGGLLF